MATKKKTSKKATAKKASKKKAQTKKATAKKAAKKSAKKTANKGARATAGKTEAVAATSRDDSGKDRIAKARKAVAKSRNYAASGLAGQVIETLLDEIRVLDKPWHKTGEAEQAVVISRISDRVSEAMQVAVQVLSAQAHKAVICNLFSVTFKDGVRATITVAPGSDMRHELADYATRDCVLVMADPGLFMQGIEDIKPDADQRRLI